MKTATKTLDEILQSLSGSQSSYVRATRRVRKRNRLMRKWTWDAYDMDCKKMSNGELNNEKVFIGASDYSDYLIAKIYDMRKQKDVSTYHRTLKVVTNRHNWANYVNFEFEGDRIIQFSESSGIVITEGLNFFKYSCSSNSCDIDIHGDLNFTDEMEQFILNNFKKVISYIEWMYSGDGSSVSVPLNVDRMPMDEMYPFLGEEKLTDYYDRFLKSSANILLLIGPPGTGKTTFIRGLLAHSESSAVVTYDASILEKDYVFARFIEDDASIMVLEDSDSFLKSRSDGNTMMHRFLNVGDGLVTTKGKKLIFSTNLPSIRDIDSALIRPGRCFDVVEFKPLSLHDANVLAEKLGTQVPERKPGEVVEYTIAEIFNGIRIESPKSTKKSFGFGFI